MKTVLQRKDGTSIFCSQLLHSYQVSTLKIRFIGAGVGLSLITLGILIMIVR